jgi:hypothetical protein
MTPTASGMDLPPPSLLRLIRERFLARGGAAAADCPADRVGQRVSNNVGNIGIRLVVMANSCRE